MATQYEWNDESGRALLVTLFSDGAVSLLLPDGETLDFVAGSPVAQGLEQAVCIQAARDRMHVRPAAEPRCDYCLTPGPVMIRRLGPHRTAEVCSSDCADRLASS